MLVDGLIRCLVKLPNNACHSRFLFLCQLSLHLLEWQLRHHKLAEGCFALTLVVINRTVDSNIRISSESPFLDRCLVLGLDAPESRQWFFDRINLPTVRLLGVQAPFRVTSGRFNEVLALLRVDGTLIRVSLDGALVKVFVRYLEVLSFVIHSFRLPKSHGSFHSEQIFRV